MKIRFKQVPEEKDISAGFVRCTSRQIVPVGQTRIGNKVSRSCICKLEAGHKGGHVCKCGLRWRDGDADK